MARARRSKTDRFLALARRIDLIEEQLRAMPQAERLSLIEQLIEDFFVTARGTLVRWGEITGQSAQLDTGYVAQHLASLVLRIPGQGFRGKGVDLRGGGEVKSASIIAGVDRPRWNHNMGTLDQDASRRKRGERPIGEIYLRDTPVIFYVLFDRVYDEASKRATDQLRVRAWCVTASDDHAWRTLVSRFLASRGGNKYNLQLHPPVGYDWSVVVNTLGVLDMASALVLEARFRLPRESDPFDLEWRREPDEFLDDFKSACGLTDYRPGIMPSRLEDVTPVEGLSELESLQLEVAESEAGDTESANDDSASSLAEDPPS